MFHFVFGVVPWERQGNGRRNAGYELALRLGFLKAITARPGILMF